MLRSFSLLYILIDHIPKNSIGMSLVKVCTKIHKQFGRIAYKFLAIKPLSSIRSSAEHFWLHLPTSTPFYNLLHMRKPMNDCFYIHEMHLQFTVKRTHINLQMLCETCSWICWCCLVFLYYCICRNALAEPFWDCAILHMKMLFISVGSSLLKIGGRVIVSGLLKSLPIPNVQMTSFLLSDGSVTPTTCMNAHHYSHLRTRTTRFKNSPIPHFINLLNK